MENQYFVYSVYDRKAERYGPLFEALNHEVAARQYVQMMKDVLPLFRGEYGLFCVGKFNFITGEFVQDTLNEEVPVSYDFKRLEEKK